MGIRFKMDSIPDRFRHLSRISGSAIVCGVVLGLGLSCGGSGGSKTPSTTLPAASVSGITLPTTASIGVGSTAPLTATVLPANATHPVVTWTSSDPTIATVSISGLVAGVKTGSADITAKSTDGSNITSNACSVSVGGSTPGPFVPQAGTTLASLGLVPFDANREDCIGPDGWNSKYGKLPEIVVSPNAAGFDVALQSYKDPKQTRTLVLRFSDGGGTSYALTQAFEAPTLGELLGFVTAPDGGFYYATATKDDLVSELYPAVGQYRENVVRVYRVDASGQVMFNVDLDIARQQFNSKAEPLINPGEASSARIAVAGDQLALVHGINTGYDPGVKARHQKAISTYLNATTGRITDVEGIWCSHSFDQRYLVDGSDLYELHLGDAFPRQVVASRIRAGKAGERFAQCNLKGATGDNNTFTRLGGMARIDAGGGSGGFLTLFAMEHGNTVTKNVNTSRDLALVRTVSDFASGKPVDAVDGTFGTTLDVTSGGTNVTNRLLWLTDYDATSSGTQHVERPKLIALGGGEFLVLWERWTLTTSEVFDGTYAMRINGAGAVLAAATRVSDSHLPRGDDAFLHRGSACFLTGDSSTGKLTLHSVSPSLAVTETVLP